tara:strand:- start:1302 stop:4577 length:3276 start_codon:yes stop_codon:yes gene_type:complete
MAVNNPHFYATQTKTTSSNQITDDTDFPHSGLIKALSLGMKGNYAVKASATDFDITQSGSDPVLSVATGKIFRDGKLHTVAAKTFNEVTVAQVNNSYHLLVADSATPPVLQLRQNLSAAQNKIPPYTEGDTIIATVCYTSEGFNNLQIQYLTTGKVANNLSIGYDSSGYNESMDIYGDTNKTVFKSIEPDSDIRFILADNTADEKFEILSDDDSDGDEGDTTVFSVDGLGATTIAGATTLSSVAAATGDTDKFLVSDSGVIKFRTGAEVLSDTGAQASLTFGISNTNAVKIDSASVADDEYARFTANGLESRSTSEVLSDIGGAALTGSTNNTIATVTGANAIAGEANLTFDGKSMTINTDTSGDGAENLTGLHVDFDRTVAGSGTAAHNDIGINLDVNSASLGTSSLIGMDIDVTGATSGTSTATGLTVDVGSADTNYAALFNGGKVGIGTVIPQTLLEIKNLTEDDGPMLRLSGSGQDGANNLIGGIEAHNADSNGDGPTVVTNIKSFSYQGSGQGGYMTFGTHDGSEGGEGSEPVERMRINGAGKVGIGATSPQSSLHIINDDTTDHLILESTADNASTHAPNLILYRNGSDTPLDNELIGEVKFRGENDNTQDVEYATIQGGMDDVSDGTEDGNMTFNIIKAGTLSEFVRLRAGTGEVVINDTQHNIDFRVEGDTADNLLRTDATNYRVGIGTGTPSSSLEIQDGLTTTGAVLTLSTKETTVVDNDIIGQVVFRAPLETGADALLPLASIHAEAAATFDATTNTTDLVFSTAAGATAAEALRVLSSGVLQTENGFSIGHDDSGYTENMLINAGSGGTQFVQKVGDLIFDNQDANDQIVFRMGSDTAATHFDVRNNSDQIAFEVQGDRQIQFPAITASRALTTDANNYLVAATTTATEIGYVNGVTSAIQTQLDTKEQIGKKTIWVPAAAMYANTTNGCSALTQVELSNGPELKVLDFDDGSDEYAQFTVAFPKSWNEGTVTFQPFWTISATGTNTVAWQLAGVGFGNSDDINTAFGTAVATTALAHSGTSGDMMVSAESGAVTISGASVDSVTYFQINRDTSADNHASDARLIGVKIFYTTDGVNDA